MRRFRLLPISLFLLSLFLVIAATGCGSSTTKLRIMNAVPNEASLDALLDTKSFATNIAYGSSTAYASASSGSRHLQIEPSGTTTTIVDTNISLSSGSNYTVLASNYSASAAAVTLTDDNSAPASGNFKLRVVNCAPGFGTAEVYIVAPGTDITGTAPAITNLAFESSSAYQSLAAGTYDVLFTLPGGKFVYLDSGSLSLSAGQIRTVVSLNSDSGGFSTAVLADIN